MDASKLTFFYFHWLEWVKCFCLSQSLTRRKGPRDWLKWLKNNLWTWVTFTFSQVKWRIIISTLPSLSFSSLSLSLSPVPPSSLSLSSSLQNCLKIKVWKQIICPDKLSILMIAHSYHVIIIRTYEEVKSLCAGIKYLYYVSLGFFKKGKTQVLKWILIHNSLCYNIFK